MNQSTPTKVMDRPRNTRPKPLSLCMLRVASMSPSSCERDSAVMRHASQFQPRKYTAERARKNVGFRYIALCFSTSSVCISSVCVHG